MVDGTELLGWEAGDQEREGLSLRQKSGQKMQEEAAIF